MRSVASTARAGVASSGDKRDPAQADRPGVPERDRRRRQDRLQRATATPPRRTTVQVGQRGKGVIGVDVWPSYLYPAASFETPTPHSAKSYKGSYKEGDPRCTKSDDNLAGHIGRRSVTMTSKGTMPTHPEITVRILRTNFAIAPKYVYCYDRQS